ncbi:DUF4097 family beta strand repeat-containing protein [Streptomyces sp. NPDC051940]|uniref:DUF4097 family beta strand repeat-containing protein n=1 Tax=Streptomyces sp. NPDC051940 TaxID=3155675 RepID=UPI00343025CB
MPTFDTPRPIDVTVDIEMGLVRFTAADTAETVVEVLPGSDSAERDVKAARETRVDFSGGRLEVRTPKSRVVFGRPGSVTVHITVPAGSRLTGTAAISDFVGEGPFGDCRLKTAAGKIRLETVGAARLTTQLGDITVGDMAGDADVSSSTGEIQIGSIDGAAVVQNSNGAVRIGVCTGSLEVKAPNGRTTVGLAESSVKWKASAGSLVLEEVVRGTFDLETRAGDIEIGIREGTAAWLDAKSQVGGVHNALPASEGPKGSAETADIKARTAIGSITVRRP